MQAAVSTLLPFADRSLFFSAVTVIALSIAHPGQYMPRDYMTAFGGYKKVAFRGQSVVKMTNPSEQPTAGYSRVSLVPPPLAPPPSNNTAANNPPMTQVNPSMNFSDPWNNRPSPGAERY